MASTVQPSLQSPSRTLLVYDLCSIAWIFYGATKLGFGLHYPLAWCGGALACRLLVAGGSAIGLPRSGWLTGILLVGTTGAFAWQHSWRQAVALVLAWAVTAGFARLLHGFLVRGVTDLRGEGLRLAFLQGMALVAIHPYIHDGLLGAGDANSYSLLTADFLQQWHAGVFPVFIGQSEFAFNGGFHPLRNAPYLLHLAGAIDLLSLRTLGVFSILNLALVGSLVAAVMGWYVALRLIIVRGPWLACGLALLYGLSPGVLAPLYGGDMYPTFLTLPFVPWLILGIERGVTQPERVWPWVLQAAALAAIAMAHPPVATWAALLATIPALWVLLVDRKWSAIKPMLAGAVVFVALAGYLVVSIADLELPTIDRQRALAQIPYLLSILRGAWWGSLQPVSAGGSALLTDIQLGYGLWGGVVLAFAGVVRARTARPWLLNWLVLLLLVWPIPGLAPYLWRGLPSMVLVTNLWPMQRLYLLLGGVTVLLIAVAARDSFPRIQRWRWAIGLLLGTACLWSSIEARKFFRRAEAISRTAAASQDLHRPENLLLSRTHSYEYVGTPAYFSYGHMDPRLETRLLDVATRQPFADATTLQAGAAGAAAGLETIELRRDQGVLTKDLMLSPGETRILRFDFQGVPSGELSLVGAHLDNSYSLPLSGLARSFGIGPTASRTLLVGNSTPEPEAVAIRFLPSGSEDIHARVSMERWSPENRVIQLHSQTPFQARVIAERDCYLETPKLFLPGYVATVDGVSAPVVRSAEGLVAVFLAQGTHEVKIVYPGGRMLRWSYAAGMTAWLCIGAIAVLYAFNRERRLESVGRRIDSAWGQFWRERRVWLLAGVAVTGGILLVFAGLAMKRKAEVLKSYGEVRMTLELPWREPGRAEPLITTGKTGAGDFIYLVYVDGKHIRVGHDRWGYGGALSEPIAVDFGTTQSVEVSMGSLYPETNSSEARAYASASLADLKGRVTIKWNGAVVLAENSSTYAARPEDVRIGENPIGGSTTTERFSGRILRVERGKASAVR